MKNKEISLMLDVFYFLNLILVFVSLAFADFYSAKLYFYYITGKLGDAGWLIILALELVIALNAVVIVRFVPFWFECKRSIKKQFKRLMRNV